jgi:hypothetical protein
MAHGVKPKLSGELNYAITKVIDDFLYDHKQHPRYDDFNTAIGVLECAKLELYRRRVALYEDGKLLENGEVYRG